MNNSIVTKFKPTTSYVHVGEFFVCNCGIPLLKHVADDQYEILKKHNGQVCTFTTKIVNGMMKVKCGKCGAGFNYINVHDSMSITDSVSVSNE